MTEKEIRSPCVSICALDDQDLCVGCYRTGQEISDWGKMSNAERKAVLQKVQEREQHAGRIIPL